MTEDRISTLVEAMLGLDAAEGAAASRAGWDSEEEWSLAWGGVVTAQIALSAAAGPHLEAEAASLEPLEAGDCAEYLRACVRALDTIGPHADMPELMVAKAYVEDGAREVAAISSEGSLSSESAGAVGSTDVVYAALLADPMQEPMRVHEGGVGHHSQGRMPPAGLAKWSSR